MSNMIDIIYRACNRLYNLLFANVTFNNPSGQVVSREDLENFKHMPEEFNKIIFALNNIPDKVFEMLFQDYRAICPKFYKLVFKTNDNTYNNLDDIDKYMDDESIRYIYIRVDIIDNSKKINHVNCIIIDKIEKYILYFEPKYELVIDTEMVTKILESYIDIGEYKFLLPFDIGYNSFNKLQKNDCFCQTYVIFIFYLIVENPEIKYSEFNKLFNSVITNENIGYFLYFIYQKYKESNLEINDVPVLWQYPVDDFRKLINAIRLSIHNNNYDGNYNMDNIIMEEEDDMVIISNIK